ncbi:patatin family protein [Fusobacterium perfoetens]|uniref:patatin-like phospholipase family protein n=1 Tax=Fusobacterium perfoetens TaxID=852 RepID=UPI001F2676B3|nr:patatin family protein [Fusobacterium perfoetens]MCF2626140.1 patatin family protein [Fusobacterium perfoetens]
MKIGLVLEGGGMRGIYTVGVLDTLLNYNYLADYLIGVSAGASNGVSYISGQKDRAKRTIINYIGDKRYLSISNYIKTGSLFGMDFLFKEIPEKLEIFDHDTFFRCKCDYRVGVTNVETGKEEYYGKEALVKEDKNILLQASASIPMAAPIVNYKGKKYLDGGTADPIPIKKAFEDGCDKVIVVLTRDRNYKKKPTPAKPIYSFVFRKYPKMVELLKMRHQIYNDTLDFIKEMEREGKAFVIAPDKPIEIERFEKDKNRLLKIYSNAVRDTEKFWEKYKDELEAETHKRV